MSSVERLQEIEQTLHSHTVQKQTQQEQLTEVESALSELGNEAYRIIGGIMVQASPDKLKSELEEKKQTLTTRITALERQESKLRDEMRQLQQELLKGDEDGKK